MEEQKAHTIISDVNQNPNIYLNLKVQKQGYLKNAKILFRDEAGEPNTNFNFIKEEFQANTIQEIHLEEKQIDLKQINYDTEVIISLPIEIILQDNINVEQLSKNNKVILQAIYVDEEAEEIEITKEITLNITWTQNNTITLSSNIEKHIPYNINSQQGILLEQKIDLTVQKQENENTLPVRKNTITLDIPSYAGIYPKDIKVTAQELTNGTQEIPEENIIIDDQTNQIQITVENQVQEGKVVLQNQEIIKITYMYPEQAYEYKDQNNIVTNNIIAKTEMYSGKTYQTELKTEQELTEKFGELVTYELEALDTKISKGKIYANYNQPETKHQTEYKTKWNIQISDTQVTQSAGVQSQISFAKTEQVEKQVNTYYKQTKINKEQLEKILGPQGYIQILNSKGEDIILVNSILPTDDQGNYIIKYEDNPENIQIITSKPETQGNIEIEHTKILDVEQYQKQEVMEFTHLTEQITGLILYSGSDTFTAVETKQTHIELLETKTKATLKLDKEKLSTLLESEELQLVVELNNHEQTSDLYKNPIFEIEFPSYIENITVKKASVLYEENLQIETLETQGNIIKVKLEGTQQDFSKGIITNGSNLILDLNVKVNILTPTIADKITLKYYNENATRYEQEEQNNMKTIQTNINGYNEQTIEFISPTGLINVSSISNYNQSDVTVQSVEQGEKTGKLEIYAPSKIAKVQNTVLNNTQDQIQDVTILGRIPHQNNKSILENTDLNSTFTANIINNIAIENGINPQNILIFYTENENATQDINIVENGWTEVVQDFSIIRSYLIKVVDTNLEPSQVISFSYNIEIPENLEHNNSTYATFATFYKESQENMQTNVKEAAKVGLTTGTGPVLNVLQTSSLENKTVTKGQRIKYNVTVTNEGQEVAEQVVAKVEIPEGAAYTYQGTEGYQIDEAKTEIDIQVGNINPNEQKIVEYELQVSEQAEHSDVIETTARIIANNLSKEMLSNQIASTVTEQVLEISEDVSVLADETGRTIRELVELRSLILITNNYMTEDENGDIKPSELKNIVFTKTIPQELQFDKILMRVKNQETGETSLEEYTQGVIFDKQTGLLKIEFEKIEAQGVIMFYIMTTTKQLQGNIYEADISMISHVQAENTETFSTNEIIVTIQRPKIIITQNCSNVDKYLAANEEMEYILKIENQSNIFVPTIVVTDIIPSELEILSIKRIRNGAETIDYNISSNTVILSILGEENSKEEIIIRVRAKDLSEETSIVNYATATLNDIEVSKTEEITHIIEKGTGSEDNTEDPNENENNNNNQNPSATYNITGLVWFDENSNGQKDEQEQNLNGITVKVLNSRDYTTIQEKTTDTSGEYKFANVPIGEYIVVFIYDSVSYKPTEYQKNGTTQNKNSSAIERQIENEGEMITGAVTDIIKITNKSASNINLGLIKRETFDLELQKTVTKITVQTSKGTNSYDFNNTQLAKIEIDSKQLAGATVIIEYKITVQNTGNIAGYAKKIADYIPKDLSYVSELNPTWYMASDGILYNTELEQALINPGETKEIQLILTKKMTSNNVGLTNNTAEIVETYNEKGIEDIDSKEENKSQAEDDLGLADVLISIKTGSTTIVLIIILSIIVLGIIAGIIIYKKREK